jgi:hypothetical protein
MEIRPVVLELLHGYRQKKNMEDLMSVLLQLLIDNNSTDGMLLFQEISSFLEALI